MLPPCRFGEGFAIAGGEQWRVRRKAVGPALHRCAHLACLPRGLVPSSIALKLVHAGARGGLLLACCHELPRESQT